MTASEKLIAVLQDARKFIRGRHSTISYGPMSLVERIDAELAALAEKPAQSALAELEAIISDLRQQLNDANAYIVGRAEKPAERPADVFVYQRVVNAAIEYISTDPEFDAGNWSNAYDKLYAAVKAFTGEQNAAERPQLSAERLANFVKGLCAHGDVNSQAVFSLLTRSK